MIPHGGGPGKEKEDPLLERGNLTPRLETCEGFSRLRGVERRRREKAKENFFTRKKQAS